MRHSSLAVAPALLLGFLVSPFAAAQGTLQTVCGSALGGHMGGAIAFPGDLNGDGVQDLVAGAPLSDVTAKPDAGRAIAYSGATGTLLYSVVGDAAGDQMGHSVCALGGDVNGDGVPDFAAGAPYNDAVGSSAGRVKVISGANGSVLATIDGEAAGDRFGWSVAPAGRASILSPRRIVVGAPYHDFSATDAGAAYLYSLTPSATLLTKKTWTQASAHFGWAVAGGRNVNGDASDDFVVGAPEADLNTSVPDTGLVAVYSGSSPYTALVLSTNSTSGSRTGFSLAMLQDVNGDGRSDVIIGSPYDASGLGSARVTGFAPGYQTFHYLTGLNNSLYGWSVGSAGDANGDARGDFIVGAPNQSPPIGFLNSGRATLYNGSNGAAIWTAWGNGTGAGFGTAVAGGVLFDGDPGGDVAIGSPSLSWAGLDSGRVEVRRGYDGIVLLQIEGLVNGDNLGASVARIGDVNADGVDDVVVGAPYADHVYFSLPLVATITDEDAGRVQVISGATGAVLLTVWGTSQGDLLGTSVDGVGDVNADGIPDFVAGATQIGGPTALAGYAKVYSGLNGAVLRTWNGTNATDRFGYAVAGVGTVNLDGVPDVAVGMPYYEDFPYNDRGGVRVFSGASGSVLTQLLGSETSSHMGWSIDSLGDVTQDGLAEYVVGEPHHDAGGVDAGRVHLVSGLFGTTISFLNGSAGENLGWSVAGLGDVDGDGDLDLAAGGPLHDAGVVADTGIVRVIAVNGSVGTGITLGQIAQRVGAANDHLGWSLAGVGDVDLDGRGDWIAGTAPINFIVFTGPGYADVVSGKTNDLLFRIDGLVTGDGFARSVAGIGDLDGDGLPDAAIGAPFADVPFQDAGCVTFVSLRAKGTSFYGTGSLGCAGSQTLATHGVPFIGNPNFGYACNAAPPSSLGLLMASNVQDLAGSDPFGLGVLLHVDLLSATEVLTFDLLGDAAGFGFAAAPVPNNPSIVGNDYYLQALWVWGSCPLPPYGLATSRGLALTVQAP